MKDLIPGRVNRLCVATGEAARLRGQCTEFCGLQHANMALHVEVMERERFQGWLDAQGRPAAAPADTRQRAGAELFAIHCARCHTVRGTSARGITGPDLTHIASRASLGAGLLPNNPGTLAAWISANQHLKPGNRMPEFPALAGHELTALSAYLSGLQ
jgi:cytochrome c oxidase subunit 2